MRLLVTTQAVDLDDAALAFFHHWLEELAARVESVEVICLKEGRHELPKNVRVHSLGKERGRASRVVYALRFFRLAWHLRHDYDAVFVHMNPEYVCLLGWWWRLRGLPVLLWYTHRQVNLKLRVAVFFTSAVASAAPESLRLASPKVHVVGHGIDTAAFKSPRDGSLGNPVTIVSVGRITPIKRLEILLEALALLAGRGVKARLSLVGVATVAADLAYERMLVERAKTLGIGELVTYTGAMPYAQMPEVYAEHDLSVNLAPTGGIDKAVLESMAAGCIPLVANRAFVPLFGEDAHLLSVDEEATDVAAKIEPLLALPVDEREALISRLVATVRREADAGRVIEKLLSLLQK